MNITVKLFATLRKYCSDSKTGTSMLMLTEGATVQEALELLNLPSDIPKILLVNGAQRSPTDILMEGDILSVFPPIAGGSQHGVTVKQRTGMFGVMA